MKRLHAALFSAAGLVLLLSSHAPAAPGDLVFEFAKPNHAGGDRFGRSMASWQDNVLISAPFDDTAASNTGAVYMYDGSGNLLQTFYNPTPYSGPAGPEYFGVSMGGIGDSVLIGDPWDSSVVQNGGAVYMFDAATAQLQRTFLNPNGAGGVFLEDIQEFGSKNSLSSVGTDGVLIGAWNSFFNDNDNDSGIAYLFSAETGDLLHTFRCPKPNLFSRFGYSTLGVGDKIAIGQPLYDTPETANGAGAVHIFDAYSYDYLYSLYDPTPDSPNAQFGYSLAALGDCLIVGGGGGAFLFDLETGELLLEASDEATHSQTQVAAVGNNILAGAKYYSSPEQNVGRAYLFDGRTGETLLTIDNPDPAEFEYFGEAVAAAGLGIVVGADYDDTLGFHSGKAYLFRGVVPEPSTLALLAVGSAVLLRRRPTRSRVMCDVRAGGVEGKLPDLPVARQDRATPPGRRDLSPV